MTNREFVEMVAGLTKEHEHKFVSEYNISSYTLVEFDRIIDAAREMVGESI